MPDENPEPGDAMRLVAPLARLARISWPDEVVYATSDALMNWGLKAAASNRQRLRACAGSWMSRTTTVASPEIVPMTRLSPDGTELEQWTRVDGPGTPDGLAGADADALGSAPEALGLVEVPAL